MSGKGSVREWERELTEIAQFARRAMEPGLDNDRQGRAISSGACLYAAVFLEYLVKKFGRGSTRVEGGSGVGCTGAADAHGVWHGHYWLRASHEGKTLVVCITGDQFGHAAVRLVGEFEAYGWFRAGDQAEVDAAAGEMRRLLGMETLP